jgi:hypothetical protein
MDKHTTVSSNGRSVRVVRRTISDSRRTQQAGSASSVERDCPPAPLVGLVGLADLAEIDARVRRLTIRDDDAADNKNDLLRMLGRLKKRFRA